MQLSGAQIIVQSLKAEGVEYVFGYPGGAVIEIYDAIFQLNKFKHILTRHEQAAVHAADAYARVSGKVGVALVTSGPGVTNALTGIATAYSDSIPWWLSADKSAIRLSVRMRFKRWIRSALPVRASNIISW